MIRPLAALSFALTVCTPAGPEVAPVPEDMPEQPATPVPEGMPEQPAAPPVVNTPAPAVPAAPLTFTTVVEGHCPALGVSRVGPTTLVHYGRDRYIGELLADGGVEDVTPPREVYPDGEWWMSYGETEAIEGDWPERPLLRFFTSEGREWSGPRYLSRGRDGRWTLLHAPGLSYVGVDRVDRWSDGNLLAHVDCVTWDEHEADCVGKVQFEVVRGPGKAPKFPELTRRSDRRDDCGHQMFDIEVRETGEITMSGIFCHRPAREGHDWFVVHHAPGRPLAVERVPLAGSDTPYTGRLALHGDDLYAGVSFGAEVVPTTRIMAREGGEWLPLAPLTGQLNALEVDETGVLWALAGDTLHQRQPGGAWQAASFVRGPVTAVGGFRERMPWVAQKDGGLWLRRGGEFEAVNLPAPLLAPDAQARVVDVDIFAADDLWIATEYTVKRPGWHSKEVRRGLLSSAPLGGQGRPLLRCAQSAKHTSERGLYPSPPAATAACPTIYAALVRRASWLGDKHAYPQLGKLLKGQQQFAGVTFSEIELGGQRIAGAAVPDLALAEALTKLVGEKLKDTRPELLCAAPPVVRPLPFDLATGKLSPGT